MSIRDLIPRGTKGREPVRQLEDWDLSSFQRDVNRLFDDVFGEAGWMSPRPHSRVLPETFSPRVNVSETEKELSVIAELPGMDEKDVTVEVDNGAVTIRGERKEEREEKRANWHLMEHTYGSFVRVIPLPVGVKGDEAKAIFKKGILTVTLPKLADAAGNRKRIAINSN